MSYLTSALLDVIADRLRRNGDTVRVTRNGESGRIEVNGTQVARWTTDREAQQATTRILQGFKSQ